MVSSNFRSAATSHLRGERVRVVSNDGQVVIGWLEQFDADSRHALLRDATLEDGYERDRGTVFVSHADTVEQLDDDARIERIALEHVSPSPFHVREFDPAENALYVDEVRRAGWADSFPVVRPIPVPSGDSYEIVEGHKRLWAAERAGFDTHPVEVVELDNWEAAKVFIFDHLPAERHVPADVERDDNWYADSDIESVVRHLVDRFGEDALDIDRVAFNADRLGVDIGGGA